MLSPIFFPEGCRCSRLHLSVHHQQPPAKLRLRVDRLTLSQRKRHCPIQTSPFSLQNILLPHILPSQVVSTTLKLDSPSPAPSRADSRVGRLPSTSTLCSTPSLDPSTQHRQCRRQPNFRNRATRCTYHPFHPFPGRILGPSRAVHHQPRLGNSLSQSSALGLQHPSLAGGNLHSGRLDRSRPRAVSSYGAVVGWGRIHRGARVACMG